ncbi:hypothetical protein K2Y11_12760 [bacterium]|nr:hypothetical protein [bacterium]
MNDLAYTFYPQWGYSYSQDFTICEGSGYRVWYNFMKLETGDELCFAHFDFTAFTATMLRELCQTYPIVRKTLPEQIFALTHRETTASRRFKTAFGFVPLNDIPCADGTVRTLYVNNLINT